MENSIALEINDLSYKYNKDKNALSNVSVSIKKGSFHGLIGSNGAGKSTLIKLIVKSLNIQTGAIRFISETNTNKNTKLSYFPDNSRFPSSISVYDYIKGEICFFKDISPKFLKEKLLKVMQDFGISDLINKSPNNLSAGQKKKVELIRIMFEEPEILILDEPTNFLDAQTRLFMFEFLKWMQSNGTTIIISSHSLHEMKDYVDSATILDSGIVRFTGDIYGDQLLELYNTINSEQLKVFKNE